MYLLIQNQNELPLWGLRLLGLSKKSKEQIGRFGTGLKEAIALLIRRNHKFVIFSGSTEINFSLKEEEGVEEICFLLSETKGRYEKEKWYGLGIHTEFGHHDWTSEWQALREIFCNALDEGGLYHELTMDVEGVPGATRVYIQATPEILESYGTIPHRILPISKTVSTAFESENFKLLEKGKLGSKFQVFHKGIWVQEAQSNSFYDLELTNLKLTESRSADWHPIYRNLSMIFLEAPVDVVSKLLSLSTDKKEWVLSTEAYFSSFMLQQSFEGKEIWKKAFYATFGENAIACSDGIHDYNNTPLETLETTKQPFYFPPNIYNTLSDCGVPTPKSLQAERSKGEFSTHEEFSKDIKDIWKLICPGRKLPKIFYYSQDQREKSVFRIENTVYVHERLRGSSFAKVSALMGALSVLRHDDPDSLQGSQTLIVKLMIALKRKMEMES